MDECPTGTSRSARLESDLSSAVSVISSLVRNFHSHALSDCYRLGKFNPSRSNPRPLLIKFIRVADVGLVLSKKGKLKSPYYIKPDMTHDQRLKESILLKERWSLIQSGIPRSSIRLRNSSLLVNKKLHGQVVGSVFKCAVDLNPLSSDGGQSASIMSVPAPIVETSQSDTHSPTDVSVSTLASSPSVPLSVSPGDLPLTSSVTIPESSYSTPRPSNTGSPQSSD